VVEGEHIIDAPVLGESDVAVDIELKAAASGVVADFGHGHSIGTIIS
jgi:hypothetical protein